MSVEINDDAMVSLPMSEEYMLDRAKDAGVV